jgi:hypothetical protein
MAELVQAGKVRAVGLSNESPYGVHEFVRLAEQHGLPRVATVQNPYCLINRAGERAGRNLHRLGVSLLAYSPLGFGLLTGKYDDTGSTAHHGRMALYDSMKAQRWGRPEALAAAPLQRAGARAWPDAGADGAGLLLHQVAGGQHHHRRDLAGQLDECLDAWGTTLSPELLAAIDAVRWELRDPAHSDGEEGKHVSETPATAWLKAHGRGVHRAPVRLPGARRRAAQCGGARLDPFAVVKTLVMQDEAAKPLVVLMHGNRTVSTKNLARQIGAKSVEPCKPEVANATAATWWAAPRPSA